MKKAEIKGFGTVELDDVCMTDGQIEVHIPVVATEELDKMLVKCVADYMVKHPNASEKELFFDVRVVFSFGSYTVSDVQESEFALSLIIWQDKDNGKDDEVEFYEEIPLTLSEEASKELKKIIWDGIGKTLFEI